jgi:hypothetical protein
MILTVDDFSVQVTSSWIYPKDTNCQKHAAPFDFYSCCFYVIPLPPDPPEDNDKKKGKSNCRKFQEAEKRVNFVSSDGKIIFDYIFDAFKENLNEFEFPPDDEWFKVVAESIETCQKISKNHFVLMFKSRSTFSFRSSRRPCKMQGRNIRDYSFWAHYELRGSNELCQLSQRSLQPHY